MSDMKWAEISRVKAPAGKLTANAGYSGTFGNIYAADSTVKQEKKTAGM